MLKGRAENVGGKPGPPDLSDGEKGACACWGSRRERMPGESGVELSVVHLLGKAVHRQLRASWGDMTL